MIRRHGALGLAAAALVVSAGCGNPYSASVSGSMEKAVVKGTVSVQGKKITSGEVSFQAANINRPNAPGVNAKIEKDGTYTAEVLVGSNLVEVSGKELNKHKNRAVVDNEKSVKIKSGSQTLDIDLPWKGPRETKSD